MGTQDSSRLGIWATRQQRRTHRCTCTDPVVRSNPGRLVYLASIISYISYAKYLSVVTFRFQPSYAFMPRPTFFTPTVLVFSKLETFNKNMPWKPSGLNGWAAAFDQHHVIWQSLCLAHILIWQSEELWADLMHKLDYQIHRLIRYSWPEKKRINHESLRSKPRHHITFMRTKPILLREINIIYYDFSHVTPLWGFQKLVNEISLISYFLLLGSNEIN